MNCSLMGKPFNRIKSQPLTATAPRHDQVMTKDILCHAVLMFTETLLR